MTKVRIVTYLGRSRKVLMKSKRGLFEKQQQNEAPLYTDYHP